MHLTTLHSKEKTYETPEKLFTGVSPEDWTVATEAFRF